MRVPTNAEVAFAYVMLSEGLRWVMIDQDAFNALRVRMMSGEVRIHARDEANDRIVQVDDVTDQPPIDLGVVDVSEEP